MKVFYVLKSDDCGREAQIIIIICYLHDSAAFYLFLNLDLIISSNCLVRLDLVLQISLTLFALCSIIPSIILEELKWKYVLCEKSTIESGTVAYWSESIQHQIEHNHELIPRLDRFFIGTDLKIIIYYI